MVCYSPSQHWWADNLNGIFSVNSKAVKKESFSNRMFMVDIVWTMLQVWGSDR